MRTSRRALLLALAAGLAARLPAPVLAGPADDVQTAIKLLKSKAAALGAPGVKGEEAVAGKSVPALYFGETKINNNFALVDEVQKEMGGTATLFVKSGDEFVRVATNVKKPDGSRAIGTVLDPKGEGERVRRQGRELLRGRRHPGQAVRRRLRADPRRGQERHRRLLRRLPEGLAAIVREPPVGSERPRWRPGPKVSCQLHFSHGK